jgi:hypothetical protein
LPAREIGRSRRGTSGRRQGSRFVSAALTVRP